MLEAARPGQQDDAEIITFDEPAVVVELFLDLLFAWGDISSTPLTTDIAKTNALLRLADKYGSDEIEKLAEKRVTQLDPWQVLKFAEEVDDLKLEAAGSLTPTWQIALVRCLAPTISLRDIKHKDPFHMILQSSKVAAEQFDP